MEKSPLNRLPAEIRSEIFEYVFTFESPIHKTGWWTATPKSERRTRCLSKDMAPILVCKQMRNETLHLPLLLNTLVCGKEVGELDPYYYWYVLPSLRDPCLWAFNALKKMTPALLSDSTTLELHLWIFSKMAEPRQMSTALWAEVWDVFEALLGVLGPVKLIVTLHFQFHYENPTCEYVDLGGLTTNGETVFEIRPGDPTVVTGAMDGLTKAINNKRQEVQQHEDHSWSRCRITHRRDILQEQLNQVKQVSGKFIKMATCASIPEDRRLLLCKQLGIDEAFARASSQTHDPICDPRRKKSAETSGEATGPLLNPEQPVTGIERSRPLVRTRPWAMLNWHRV